MGRGRKSKLHKGVRNTTSDLRDKLDALVAKGHSTGYSIKTNSITSEEEIKSLNDYVDLLARYQSALDETPEVIRGAGGTVELYAFSNYAVLGDSAADGTIRMSKDRITSSYNMEDTLPHEHTHNLMDYLIEKELGFKRGSYEFNAARQDAIMYKSVNTAAFNTWKTETIARIQSEIDTFKPTGGKLDSFMLQSLKTSLRKVKSTTTPYGAARFSGMRDYATRDYSWTTKGAGMEIPTVSSELFTKHGYNWSEFKKTGSYAYYVLDELHKRLKK